jgi:hypothetical protein
VRSLPLSSQYLDIFVRSIYSKEAFQFFSVMSISRFTLHHFNFWKEWFTNMCIWKGSSFFVHGHQVQETCQQVDSLYKLRRWTCCNLFLRCVSHWKFIMCLKFGWNSLALMSNDTENKLIVVLYLLYALKMELNLYWILLVISQHRWVFCSQNWEVWHTIWSQLWFPQLKLSHECSYYVKHFIDKVICSL